MPLKPFDTPILQRVPPAPWAALVLFVAVWAVYAPALNRVFAGDQLWYFAELEGSTSLVDGLRHYDYAATRRYWKGDDALFRPLLFVWLAVQNHLFSYHHVWWNFANLVLHGLVALSLFRLLVRVAPSPFALPAAVLFAVMKPPFELVIWNHLGGYLLACVFLLVALRAFVRLTAGGEERAPTRVWTVYALAFTIAGLFHEAMVAMSVVAGLTVAAAEWHRRGRRPGGRDLLSLAFPFLVFLFLYLFHAVRVQRLSYVDRPDADGILNPGNVIRVLPAALETIARWTVETALPAALSFSSMPFSRLGKTFALSWQDPLQLLNAVVIVILLTVLVFTLSSRRFKRALPLLVFLVSAVVVYTAVVCFGRASRDAVAVAYYPYVFCLLAVALSYAVIDLEQLTGWKARVAGIALVVFVLVHATGTRSEAREVARVNDEAARYLTQIARFVDIYRNEPDFTFAIAAARPHVDPEVSLRAGYPDEPGAVVQVRRVTEILFKRYYNEKDPKYVLP